LILWADARAADPPRHAGATPVIPDPIPAPILAPSPTAPASTWP